MKKKLVKGINYTLQFECEDFEGGMWLDTKVYINGTYLCTISGSDVGKFEMMLDAVVTIFRI